MTTNSSSITAFYILSLKVGDDQGLGLTSETPITNPIPKGLGVSFLFVIFVGFMVNKQVLRNNLITRIIYVSSLIVPKVRQVWKRKDYHSSVLVKSSPPPSRLYQLNSLFANVFNHYL
ncbi:hypothetical protein DVH24_018852 [Malus domestica]|uniref:Uncharacterized protein n=1 Tax=Malus domestica TaxID=3750 RepID=A0A498HQ04_MALDO|nr:hypothetical protein DVH24_018852 [Malus domestica]